MHGGLNRLSASLNRAETLVPTLMKAGYYPILFGWRSGPFLSYFEHLLVVRQGRKRWWAPVTSPFVLIADLGRGITRAPLVVWRQAQTVAKTMSTQWNDDSGNAQALYAALRKRHSQQQSSPGGGPGGAISVSIGEDKRSWFDRAIRAIAYAFTLALALKFVFALLLDGLGKAAWENMLRRTKVVFRTPSEFDIKKIREDSSQVDAALRSEALGAVSGLFSELTNLINPRGSADSFSSNYEITLVGHSMGAIIMNEAIRLFPDLPFKSIVYMGAACSVREFMDSVVSYLVQHQEARFYNLCLHPIAEAREIPYGWVDLLPRGSLLEWIDNLFSAHHTLLDRRLGKWDNIMQATHMIPVNVGDRVTIKAFGVGADQGKPQMHGQFGDIEFWDSKVRDSISQ